MGVTGSSPLTTAVQKSVSLDIHKYANQSALENAANQAKIYGGFVPQTNTLILSVAASLPAPSVMSSAYGKAAKQAGVKLQAKEINTLPFQDPEGVVPGITLFVLLLAGYLGSTFAMQRTKTAATHHRVLASFGHAILAALVVDLPAGPILGAYPNVGSNFWKLWPEFALICCAAALLAATLQSLIGSIGTLVAIILIVFIGNPLDRWRQRSRVPATVLAGHRSCAAPTKRAAPDPQHALPSRQQHHPADHRPRHLRSGRDAARHDPFVGTPAMVARGSRQPFRKRETARAHQPGRGDGDRRHTRRLTIPRSVGGVFSIRATPAALSPARSVRPTPPSSTRRTRPRRGQRRDSSPPTAIDHETVIRVVDPYTVALGRSAAHPFWMMPAGFPQPSLYVGGFGRKASDTEANGSHVGVSPFRRRWRVRPNRTEEKQNHES